MTMGLYSVFIFLVVTTREIYTNDGCSGTTKVRNSGLGPDPDLSAKSGPE